MSCPALYRQLSSSLSSLKAVSCDFCTSSHVDPLFERETLLIIIDWILLRPEAYRHVLFNVVSSSAGAYEYITESTTGRTRKRKNVKEPSTTVSSPFHSSLRSLSSRHLLQLLALSCLLLAYVKNEAAASDSVDRHPSWRVFSLFLFIAALELLVHYISVYGVIRLQQIKQQQVFGHKLAMQVLWALVLPTMLHVVSVVVLIVWENSRTIRLLSSLLVNCWQILGLSLLIGPLKTTETRVPVHRTTATNKNSHVYLYTAPILGMITVSLWRYLMSTLILKDVDFLNGVSNPCIGIKGDDVITTIRSIKEMVDISTSPIKLESSSIFQSICLT